MKNIRKFCKESNNRRREVAQRPLNKSFQLILQTDKTVDEYLSWALHIVTDYDIQHIEGDLLRIQSDIFLKQDYQPDDLSTTSVSTTTENEDDMDLSYSREDNNIPPKLRKTEAKMTLQKTENPNMNPNSQYIARQNGKVVKDAR